MAHYGWVRDSLDIRDHYWSVHAPVETLPQEYSLRNHMPPVYDQGDLGSCTANAIAGAVQYRQMLYKQPEGLHVPSRLFIYYNEREMEGNVDYDAGANLRDGIKSLKIYGAPPEEDWEYDISKFKTKPPAQVYTFARQHVDTYGRVAQNAQSFISSVYYKHPIVFGFTVYESFESDEVANTGIMPMPDVNNEQILGGHAVAMVGWKSINNNLYIECRNSWGDSWGDHGYFFMPATYAVNPHFCADFWHINHTQ